MESYALILETRLRRKLRDDWAYLNQERIGSLWRPWKLLKLEIAPMRGTILACGELVCGSVSVI